MSVTGSKTFLMNGKYLQNRKKLQSQGATGLLPPKQITSILIYAYSRGVFSSREIEKRCNEDLSSRYSARTRTADSVASVFAEKETRRVSFPWCV